MVFLPRVDLTRAEGKPESPPPHTPPPSHRCPTPPQSAFPPAKMMDLAMMLLSGGKDRTENEFRTLFESSGWRLSRVISTASQLSVIEGVPN